MILGREHVMTQLVGQRTAERSTGEQLPFDYRALSMSGARLDQPQHVAI